MWIIQKALRQLKVGQITIYDPNKNRHHFQGSEPGPHPVLHINDWSGMRDILRRGDIGLGEAYMSEKIHLEDIGAFIQWVCLNEEHLKPLIYGRALSMLKNKLFHVFNKNSLKGSRRNIEFHYDLGNDFYSLWLDKSKTYSAALFKDMSDADYSRPIGMADLFDGQIAKFDRIVDQLQARPGQSVFEIGCGWGAFLERLMQKTEANYYGITLSQEQYTYCQDLIQKNGWENRAQIEVIDYRKVTKKFDHIISVEMIEAVGYEYWPKYVHTISQCLKSGGAAIIQGISIRKDLFASYLRGTDFIQQYIFPGGVLIELDILTDLFTKDHLKLEEVFSFGKSYAKTLRTWSENMRQVEDKILALGFDNKFYRMWQFYFGYCEGAFLAERINVSQIRLQKL